MKNCSSESKGVSSSLGMGRAYLKTALILSHSFATPRNKRGNRTCSMVQRVLITTIWQSSFAGKFHCSLKRRRRNNMYFSQCSRLRRSTQCNGKRDDKISQLLDTAGQQDRLPGKRTCATPGRLTRLTSAHLCYLSRANRSSLLHSTDRPASGIHTRLQCRPNQNSLKFDADKTCLDFNYKVTVVCLLLPLPTWRRFW
jgi:hypothetical protein